MWRFSFLSNFTISLKHLLHGFDDPIVKFDKNEKRHTRLITKFQFRFDMYRTHSDLNNVFDMPHIFYCCTVCHTVHNSINLQRINLFARGTKILLIFWTFTNVYDWVMFPVLTLGIVQAIKIVLLELHARKWIDRMIALLVGSRCCLHVEKQNLHSIFYILPFYIVVVSWKATEIEVNEVKAFEMVLN